MNRHKLARCEGEGKSDHLRGVKLLALFEIIITNVSPLSLAHVIIFPLMINRQVYAV